MVGLLVEMEQFFSMTFRLWSSEINMTTSTHGKYRNDASKF
jgi:hypothetical protein